MNIRIEFNLPEDELQYDDFLKGPYYRAIVTDLHAHLRQINKYGKDGEPASKDVEEIYRHLCESLISYSIEL